MRSRTLDAAGTPLQVHEWGEPGGAALLFWHALGDHTGLQMAEVAPILADHHGAYVVSVDAPGFGGSPPLAAAKDYRLANVSRIALAAADALGLERPALAGASWGGSLALAAAATARERLRGIAALDSGYQPPITGKATLAALQTHWRGEPGFRWPSWDAWREDTRATFPRLTPDLEEALRAGIREDDDGVMSIMGPDVYASVIWSLIGDSWADYLDGAAASGLPVLLLVATEPADKEGERAEQLAAFAARVPQAEIVRIEGARHSLLEDDPEAVARELGGWLARLYA
jgi:pimeloyl-ACP methyl ester carboxylesterase